MTYLSHQDVAHTAVLSRRLAESSSGKADAEKLNLINGKLRRFAHVFVFFVLAVLCGTAFLMVRCRAESDLRGNWLCGCVDTKIE